MKTRRIFDIKLRMHTIFKSRIFYSYVKVMTDNAQIISKLADYWDIDSMFKNETTSK
jgi:hypothetical protein